MSSSHRTLQPPSVSLWRQALQRFVDVIPHTQALGMRVVAVDASGVTLYLPGGAELCGDRSRSLVHSGVLSVLLDTACGASVLPALPSPEVCPTLDLHISHRRPACQGASLWVRAEVEAITDSVVFTEARAWQHEGQVVACARGHFARLGPRNTPAGFAEAMFAGLVEDEGDPHIEEKAPVGDADSGAIAAAPHESVSGLLERGRASGEINAWLGEVPYADFIGVREDSDERGRRFVLETRPHNVGNPMLPALHGGVVSAFLETAAALDTLAQTREPRLPRLVNVTVDYLSSAGVKPTFARCRLVREGRRMANVEAWAWQDDEDAPVARARLTYVLGAPA